MDKEILNKMSLRQVMEFTRSIPINEGGLEIFLEKIVSEIECLKKRFDEMYKNDKSFDPPKE